MDILVWKLHLPYRAIAASYIITLDFVNIHKNLEIVREDIPS